MGQRAGTKQEGLVRSGHRIDHVTWLRALESHRIAPGNLHRAAVASGTSDRTSKRLWEDGYPRFSWGAKSLRQLIAEEHGEAERQAKLEFERERDLDPEAIAEARRLAIETRTEEAKMLRYTRVNTLGLLNMTTQLLRTGLTLAKKVDERLSDPDFFKGMTLATALITTNRIAQVVAKGIYAAEACANLERAVLGDPKERAGFENAEGEMAEEEALAIIDQASAIAARVKERGLRIIQGGDPAKAAASKKAKARPSSEGEKKEPMPPAPPENPEELHGGASTEGIDLVPLEADDGEDEPAGD